MGSGTEADEDIDSFQGVIMHVTDSMLQPKTSCGSFSIEAPGAYILQLVSDR